MSKRGVLLVSAALLCFCPIACVSPDDGYTRSLAILKVNPNAKDDTQDHFTTLSDALIAARKLRGEDVTVEVVLADGIHYISEPVIIDASLSGEEGKPFLIRSSSERGATLSGAKPVKLDWQSIDENIYVAQVTESGFDALFIEGERQTRARYPNYNAEITPYGGFSADVISPERVASWANPTTGIFHALHDGRWGGWHHKVEGVDENGELVLSPGAGNNRPSEPHPDFRYIENIFEELDAPGEWFHDEESKKIYFYPDPSIDLTNASVKLSTTENLIEVRGTSEIPVKHVEINGLRFEETKMTFLQTTEPLLRSDWMVHRGAAIIFEGTEDSFVRNSLFEDLGGNAIFFSGYNRDSGATGNMIHRIGGSGISVIGKPDAVRSPSFTYLDYVDIAEMDFGVGPRSPNYPLKTLIEDNLITDIGLVEKQVAGIQIAMASRVSALNNSIYMVPRAGINVGDGTWGGHILRGNDVFDTVLETGDHGAFNSWGRDRFWHPDRDKMDEIVRSYPDLVFADAMEPTIIENNRWQSDYGWDIDLDDGASNYIIRKNLCLSGGLKLREGFRRIATNNILLNNSFHPHVWFENSQDVFRHNIVMTDYKEILVDDWGDEINENFFPTESALQKSQNLGNDQNSIFGDAQFLDASSGDFRVKDTSPALSIGFRSFPMQFGVKSDWLRRNAKTPKVPQLFLNSEVSDPEETIEFLGARVRSVTTEGDKSAYGLPAISGVIVESVSSGSLAEKGGLLPRDVIVGAFDQWNADPETIGDINALRSSYQARRWIGLLSFVVIRNQSRKEIFVDITQ